MLENPNAWSPTSPVDIDDCEQSFKQFVRGFDAGEQEAEEAPRPSIESPSKRAITNIANIIKNKSVVHVQEAPGAGTLDSSPYLGTQRKSGDEGDADYAQSQLHESNTPSVWISHDNRGGSTLQDDSGAESLANVVVISENNDPNVIY